MAYTTKDLEKQKKQQGISKDKLSYAVAQGGNAAALAGGMAKQGINAAKQVGYGIGTIKTLLNKPKDYEESDEVKQAQENLKNHYNSKPGDYQSNYADQMRAMPIRSSGRIRVRIFSRARWRCRTLWVMPRRSPAVTAVLMLRLPETRHTSQASTI